ncbi:MAG: hypothetical protein ABIR91_01950 [Candidatus Saccharimonadales bacterium]
MYGIVWTAKRRNEMVRDYKLSVPHWFWLVLPVVIIVGLLGALIVTSLVLDMDGASATLLFFAFTIIALIASFGISIWWMWRFGKAAEAITQGRIGADWVLAHWIILGTTVLFILQYQFNRALDPPVREKIYKPSAKFIKWSVVAFAVALLLGVVSEIYSPGSQSFDLMFQEAIGGDQLRQKSDALLTQYNQCTEALDADYPGELTVDNEAAYDIDYAHCEDLRVKQNAAADAYNKSLE